MPTADLVGADLDEWADETQRLNKRWESEVEKWAWFMAHAMAVSAGYTSHGENSRLINRHGPSRK